MDSEASHPYASVGSMVHPPITPPKSKKLTTILLGAAASVVLVAGTFFGAMAYFHHTSSGGHGVADTRQTTTQTATAVPVTPPVTVVSVTSATSGSATANIVGTPKTPEEPARTHAAPNGKTPAAAPAAPAKDTVVTPPPQTAPKTLASNPSAPAPAMKPKQSSSPSAPDATPPDVTAATAPEVGGILPGAANPFEAPTPATSTKVGGKSTPARPVRTPAPVYPVAARTRNLYGDVTISGVVDTKGNVTNLKPISGNPILSRAAMDALQRWQFEPAMLDGRPTPEQRTFKFEFAR